eukprot:tig00000692_g3233.t1
MATRTFVQHARAHDNLYDPVYSVSGVRDHMRAQQGAGTYKIERVPDAANFFSEVALYPRFVYRIRNNDLVPPWVERTWRGPDPRPEVNELNVTGHHRYKYFRRPRVPFLHAVPPEVVLAAPDAGTMAGEAGGLGGSGGAGGAGGLGTATGLEPVQESEIALTRTVATMTDYREQESQTDPYTPDYTVRPGSAPELLTLATLAWGAGLPAGMAEVEMIERMRAKRAFEASLPPITDEASLEMRRRMMEEQELREWAEREAEIARIQERRLQVIEEALLAKDQEREEKNASRTATLRAAGEEEVERVIAAIQLRRIKALRKLAKARRAIEGKVQRRDVIQEYANYGSQVYAPITRKGQLPDRHAAKFEVDAPLLKTYEGLVALENSLPRSVVATRIKKPVKLAPRSVAERKEKQLWNHLELLDSTIKDAKKHAGEPPRKLEIPAAYRAEPPPVRPVTPTVEPPEIDEEREVAVIFLQRLIRGRAIQNVMFEGKEKRLELIKELRTMEKISQIESEIEEREEKERVRRHKEKMVGAQLDAVQGDVLGTTLDFFAKELVRFKEERRIQAMVMLAERTRRRREAEEAGRRQEEELRRAREDEQFRQIVAVHQGTVDSYLEEIVAGVIDRSAEEQAAHEARVKAERINTIVDLLEERYNDPETIVTDLVRSFLLPEVERSRLRHAVEQEQRKHIHAAHNEIYASIDVTAVDRAPRDERAPSISSLSSGVPVL